MVQLTGLAGVLAVDLRRQPVAADPAASARRAPQCIPPTDHGAALRRCLTPSRRFDFVMTHHKVMVSLMSALPGVRHHLGRLPESWRVLPNDAQASFSLG